MPEPIRRRRVAFQPLRCTGGTTWCLGTIPTRAPYVGDRPYCLDVPPQRRRTFGWRHTALNAAIAALLADHP